MVRIHLSDGSFFVLHAEVHAREGVRAGDCLEASRIDSLCAQSELVFARHKALALLARAPQTRRGLAQKLRARGFSPAAVSAALARMGELGYLDDLAFAENWIRSRLSARREGFKALYKGLLQRGVARETAETAVAGLCGDEVEMENARHIADGLSAQAAVRKLSSRGFRSRTISRLLKEIRNRDREAGAP
jgi:regulatory protein